MPIRLVAIDRTTDTATLTLLNMHIIPKIGFKEWTLDNVVWDIVAEIKVPIPALNALVSFYVQEISNGLDVVPLIERHLQDHPINVEKTGTRYGPTAQYKRK